LPRGNSAAYFIARLERDVATDPKAADLLAQVRAKKIASNAIAP
jgi:hypothetical protein